MRVHACGVWEGVGAGVDEGVCRRWTLGVFRCGGRACGREGSRGPVSCVRAHWVISRTRAACVDVPAPTGAWMTVMLNDGDVGMMYAVHSGPPLPGGRNLTHPLQARTKLRQTQPRHASSHTLCTPSA
eukprot:363477-Chlamydomonas_euryale.AAC.4